jgi:hypothetical protein
MRDQHTHICATCGRVWTCSDPSCWPADDQCRACEVKQADDWWTGVELQKQLMRERAEREQPRLEF